MPQVVHVGLALEEGQLYINHDAGNGWVEFGGEGVIGDDGNRFAGSYESENAFIDLDENGRRDEGEPAVSFSETFILNW